MSEGGGSPDVSALVEALDARARQAGNEGAATLVRGVIGSLSETLTQIDDRLDRLEGSIAGGSRNDQQLLDAVHTSLVSLNGRLARLEEAFVQALEESGDGAVAVVEQVREAITELLPASMPEPAQPPPPPEPVDLGPMMAALAQVSERMSALEQRETPVPVIPPFPDPVDLEPVVDRLRVLDGRLASIEARPEPAPPEVPVPEPIDLAPVLADGLAPVLARLAQLEEQMQRLADAPAPSVEAVSDPEVNARLDEVIEVVRRDDLSTRLVSAVEERMNAAVRAVTDRIGSANSDIAALRDQRESVQRRLDDLGGALTALRVESDKGSDRAAAHDAAIERLHAEVKEGANRWPAVQAAQAESQRLVADLASGVAGLRPMIEEQRTAIEAQQQSTAELLRAVEAVSERLQTLDNRVAAGAEASAADDRDRVTTGELHEFETRMAEAVRREAELLTQRVASLAVGVEATRAMCEQLAEAAEQSLGRKAGEVGRRLAQDFGLRSRRNTRDRGDRGLGPGY